MPENVYMATDAMIPGLPNSGPVPQPQVNAPRPQAYGIPRFRLVPIHTAADGWKNVEFVDILTPGDNKSMPSHKVNDRIRQMYPVEYDRWRKGLEMAPEGWPLEMWPVLSPAQVYALKAINIFTVEQLTQIADSSLAVIPMGKTLRNQAQAALKAKKESDSVESERRKNELLKDTVAMMEERLAAMQAQLDAKAAPVAEVPAEQPKRGPGRPPKEAA